MADITYKDGEMLFQKKELFKLEMIMPKIQLLNLWIISVAIVKKFIQN